MAIDLEKYQGKKIHVVGVAGAEGSAIAEFLVAKGFTDVTAHDFSADETEFERNFNNTHLSLNPIERSSALDHLCNLPIAIHLRDQYLQGIEEADVVFVSQVWFKYPANAPLKPLFEKGVEFKTITNLYFEFAPCPIISVTGTNGKTTTSNLLKHIFERWERENAPRRFFFAGNDRQNVQVLDRLEEMKSGDVFLLETSSTQLVLNAGLSPHIGIITNITPNHLDDHGTYENYIRAKESMIDHQEAGDFAVLNADNVATAAIATRHQKNACLFSTEQELAEGCFMRGDDAVIRFRGKGDVLFNRQDLQIFGEHNLANALAAAAAAYLFGVAPETIRSGISTYPGIRHRLKLIYKIDGISYFDDTQSTTPDSTIAGLKAFSGGIVLLLGGDNKGMDYDKLGKVASEKAKAVILFPGTAAEDIERSIDKDEVALVKTGDLPAALDILKEWISTGKVAENDVVLISPAAAHFYSKFVESTGRDLKEWIRGMKR